MNSRKLLPLLFLLIPLISLGQMSPEDELKDLLNKFMDKVNEKDMHDRFWADDLVYTSSSGTRFGKDHIMAGFKDSEQSKQNEKPSYTAQDVRVKMLGEVAAVTFKLVNFLSDGKMNEYFNSGIFIKRKGQWQAVIWQATKIPKE